jgi:hypothetical protein
MPPVALKFSAQVPGGKEFVMGLSRFTDKISDFTPFWSNYFLPTWYAFMLQQYDTQGGSTGEPWASLSENYSVWKQKHWPGQPIGVLTGKTRSSFTQLNDPNAYTAITPTEFAVGSQLDYPIYLQLGTDRMPARPPLRLTQQFMSFDVAKLLQKFANDALKAAKVANEQ